MRSHINLDLRDGLRWFSAFLLMLLHVRRLASMESVLLSPSNAPISVRTHYTTVAGMIEHMTIYLSHARVFVSARFLTPWIAQAVALT